MAPVLFKWNNQDEAATEFSLSHRQNADAPGSEFFPQVFPQYRQVTPYNGTV
ncbi:MAG: hypothetical protein L6Q81_06640 [Bacteroidia bacterium]|nr:hypothetical protein [Bacteroidia bacterium]